MSIEIHGVSVGGISPDFGKSEGTRNPALQQRTPPPVSTTQTESDAIEHDRILREMLEIPESLQQRKLKYSVMQELDMVVVKVIDAETDTLIKEIPPQEIQSLHIRIREALGLFIDEKV